MAQKKIRRGFAYRNCIAADGTEPSTQTTYSLGGTSSAIIGVTALLGILGGLGMAYKKGEKWPGYVGYAFVGNLAGILLGIVIAWLLAKKDIKKTVSQIKDSTAPLAVSKEDQAKKDELIAEIMPTFKLFPFTTEEKMKEGFNKLTVDELKDFVRMVKLGIVAKHKALCEGKALSETESKELVKDSKQYLQYIKKTGLFEVSADGSYSTRLLV